MLAPCGRYGIGAMLLDLNNPLKVIGRLDEPLISPTEKERDGYVPNVAYSCGAMIHGGRLYLPFATSDRITRHGDGLARCAAEAADWIAGLLLLRLRLVYSRRQDRLVNLSRIRKHAGGGKGDSPPVGLIAFPEASSMIEPLTRAPADGMPRLFFLTRNTDDHGRFQRSRTGPRRAGELGNPRSPAAAKPGSGTRRAGQLAAATPILRRSGPAAAAAATIFTPMPTSGSIVTCSRLHDEGKRVDITLLVERLRQVGRVRSDRRRGLPGRSGAVGALRA